MGNILRKIRQYFTGKEAMPKNPDNQSRAQAESYKIPGLGDAMDPELLEALRLSREADVQRLSLDSGLYDFLPGEHQENRNYMGPERAPADLYKITDADFTPIDTYNDVGAGKVEIHTGLEDMSDTGLLRVIEAAREADVERPLSSSGTDLYFVLPGEREENRCYMGPERAPVDPQPEVFVDGRDFGAADPYNITNTDFTIYEEGDSSVGSDDGGSH